MSYTLQVQNGTPYTWLGSDGGNVPPNATWNVQGQTLGNAWIKCDQLGTLNFLDIADTHIPGDSGQTWGVLVSYQGEEIVGRYEGGGQLAAAINQFGQVTLSGNMSIRQVSLSGFIQQTPTFE